MYARDKSLPDKVDRISLTTEAVYGLLFHKADVVLSIDFPRLISSSRHLELTVLYMGHQSNSKADYSVSRTV